MVKLKSKMIRMEILLLLLEKKVLLTQRLKENYDVFMKTLLKEKPTGIKGNFVLSAYLTSTMGVSYRLKL